MSPSGKYDWYEQDFTSFLLSLQLPAYCRDTAVKDALESERKSFLNKFDAMILKDKFRGFSNDFYSKLAEKREEIGKNFERLISIVEAYDNADMSMAQTQFDSLMESIKSYLFVGDIYWPHLPTNFYRVRVSLNEKLKEPKDLFHIPYKKRHLVSNERYSLAGHPCLYLASYLHIAWQECGCPHKYYYSEFQYQHSEKEEWKFITFLSPREIATTWFVAINPPEDDYLRLAESFLLTYPLVFACSIVNLNGNSAFKPEFVIPQMLTQWIYRNYDFVKGVKSFSCYDADDIRHFNGFNVVMPAKNIDYRRGLSKDLVSKFKVSKPVLLENKLSDDEATVVRKYKEDLLNVMHASFEGAFDCLNDMYLITDLLDKAIRNADNSDMRFVISAVRSVSRSGRVLLEKYRPDIVIDKGRADLIYSNRTEDKIEAFRDIYNRFPEEIIGIAEEFDLMIDRIASQNTNELFYV